MSCSPFDLRDYLFEELPAAEGRQVEQHVDGCASCREELERLRVTTLTLKALPDEEPPRRIAFVSDKVFEPRWWQFWNTAPRLGFASALMLSAALLVHTYARPVPVVPMAELQARVEAEVSKKLAAIPVAEMAAPRDVVTKDEAARLVQAAENRVELQRRMDRMALESDLDYLGKQIGQYKRASLESRGLR
jgi:hypothetical protein